MDANDNIPTIFNTSNFFDTIDTNGNWVYVAYLMLFWRLVLAEIAYMSYWERMENYKPHLSQSNETIGSDGICAMILGQSLFRTEGLCVMTDYITVDHVLVLGHGGECG